MPKLVVMATQERITSIEVIRGAPCGATWRAAKRMLGLSMEDAAVRMGLEAQYFCSADPAGWDPIHGKSPVHIAGELHKAALVKALQFASSS